MLWASDPFCPPISDTGGKGTAVKNITVSDFFRLNGIENVVDQELMLDKTIKQPISRIIEALGWDWNDVDPSRTTLAQWGLG